MKSVGEVRVEGGGGGWVAGGVGWRWLVRGRGGERIFDGIHAIGRFFDATRRSPLSPALSPEYREEGEKRAGDFRNAYYDAGRMSRTQKKVDVTWMSPLHHLFLPAEESWHGGRLS